MSSRADSSERELLRLYSLASTGEYNLAQFLLGRPEFVALLDVSLDLERDDAELALQLAAAVGRYKRRAVHRASGDRTERVAAASRQLIATSRPRAGSIELDAKLVLGGLLADNTKKYIAFELIEGRIPILRAALVRTRAALRSFEDVTAFVDLHGLHFRWRGGIGGLNFRPQVQERGASFLHLDFRRPLPARTRLPHPVRLADVLSELGFP